jgi:hypothetical protein
MAFASVRTEGGLFPLDLLEQIYEAGVEGQRPEAFGLVRERRIVDEAAMVWSAARYSWGDFKRKRDALPPEDRGTRLTRSDWVEPFLRLLGYDLRFAARAARVGGASYPVSHRAVPDHAREAERLEEAPPVHIVSFRHPLDRRAEGERVSPQAMLQDYLNRSEHLWGLLTNGLSLRLLRESAHLARPAYLEFDLEKMLDGEHFPDFVLLYRLLHRSRLPATAADGAQCLLEKYYQIALEQGGRVRDRLRDGVEEALKALGNGFLRHPANQELRQALESGRLSAADFYAQLLRLVYRFLFLMVAEERKLLTDHAVYHEHYSLRRLRDLCERPLPTDRYDDLYRALKVIFQVFRDDRLAAKFEAAPLNGDLFSHDKMPHLEAAELHNRDLLQAMRHLSRFRENERAPLRRVNYAALDVEELGSVYESLLEFQPVVRRDGVRLLFEFAQGTERRSTGSYYTPPELVRELVEHALVPVMEERLAAAKTKDEQERALLSLNVCDPATGSGHFLLAAARRIGRELARIRTGEEEPPSDDYRQAVRDVITHCLYGVDKNPLAVDLCKVALWIEGHNRGLPLTFLDHRIKLGDSLVGVADLKVLEKGIPDEAYQRTDASQKAIAKALKARNKLERTGQLQLAPVALDQHLLDLALLLEELERTPDDSPRRVAEKAQRYEQARGPGSHWWADMTACHLWTAPFFMELRPGDTATPTTGTLRRYLQNPQAAYGPLVGEVWCLAQEHRFFHWPLEFPDMFMADGFDVVLSNPPFMGGLKISERFGDAYRNLLTTVFAPAGGTADLCAYFYRRAFDLLRPGGHLGMVATNTIGQGDTREGGLAVIVRNGGTITFARRFIKWPGAANVEVNLLAIRRGPWRRQCLLDGEPMLSISSWLDDEPELQPKALLQNRGKAFQGSIVRGIGFVLEPEEAQALIAKDPRNRDCLFPYLNGEDLNSRPDQSPSRWVICFRDWPLSKAQGYPGLLRIVEERVKPEREKVKQAGDREKWWLFSAYRVEMHQAIAPLRRVLVRAQTAEHHMMSFVDKSWVYAHTVIVFAFDDEYHFSLFQSSVHEVWVRKFSSTLETRGRYIPTDCFDTFPFPQEPSPEDREWAARVGGQYHEHRRQAMLSRSLGLTKTYNLFHNPECQDEDIARLRELHAEMDRAILACYGWQDIDPGHGFYQNERGQTRYTISPGARCEILRRLLALNLRIAGEEARGSIARAATRARR